MSNVLPFISPDSSRRIHTAITSASVAIMDTLGQENEMLCHREMCIVLKSLLGMYFDHLKDVLGKEEAKKLYLEFEREQQVAMNKLLSLYTQPTQEE